jgi:peptidoglycan hydrolase CwlO-like protein
MSKKQIVNAVLILGLLTFPLIESAFAEDVLPTTVKEPIEINETFEKKDGSATDKQKAKKKAASEEQEAITKAKIEWQKANREKQEARTKAKMDWQKANREKQEATMKAKKEEQKAEKKKSTKNVPDEFWMIKEMGGVK